MSLTTATAFITSMASAGDVSTYTTTATGAPAADALALVFVYSKQGAATAATPTIVGGGITTWSLHTTVAYNTIATPTGRISMFRALEAAPGAASIITVDFGGTAQQKCILHGVEYTGAKTSGSNGADAVVQVGVGQSNSGSTMTITLGSAVGANNATGGAFYTHGSATVTAGAGYAIVGSSAADSSRAGHESRLVGAQAVDMSFSAEFALGGIAYEVAVAGSVVGESTTQRAIRRRRR